MTRTPEEIRASVRERYTGNPDVDLREYRAVLQRAQLDLDVAIDECAKEASRRYERRQRGVPEKDPGDLRTF